MKWIRIVLLLILCWCVSGCIQVHAPILPDFGGGNSRDRRDKEDEDNNDDDEDEDDEDEDDEDDDDEDDDD